MQSLLIWIMLRNKNHGLLFNSSSFSFKQLEIISQNFSQKRGKATDSTKPEYITKIKRKRTFQI